MDMKYRSRSEIASYILEAANGGATKTRIMYKAFLSYAQLKEYLSMLEANGLLRYERETQRMITTSKGLKFLQLNNQMDQLAYGEREQEIETRVG